MANLGTESARNRSNWPAVEPRRVAPNQAARVDPIHFATPSETRWPIWMRFAVIATATGILCSCRGLPRPSAVAPPVKGSLGPGTPESLPASAWTGAPESCEPTLDVNGTCPWRPPGIVGPWPRDEYLCDGGDREVGAIVRSDGQVDGMDSQDTIAYFDTLDGRTLVEPSNRVCVYAPRFGAVRQVEIVSIHDARTHVAKAERPDRPAHYDERQFATTSLQRKQPVGKTSIRVGSTYRNREQGGELEAHQRLAATNEALPAYADFQLMRIGKYGRADEPGVRRAALAAITWSKDQFVQVLFDGRPAIVLTGDQQVDVIYGIDEPDHPKLRVVKIASTNAARPGETVDFTIRYDNVGDQAIGNVTLIDNLTTRLEYLPKTAQSSAEADFSTQPNQVGSVQLRWEIKEPLEPGHGGTVRFRCRVR